MVMFAQIMSPLNKYSPYLELKPHLIYDEDDTCPHTPSKLNLLIH